MSGTQAIGDRVARVLEREYQRIGRALQTFPSEPITVMLYTNREFQDLTRAPGWAAGSYDGRIRVAVGGSASEGEIDRVVTHELVHAVIATAGRVPAWLNEGLATHLESSDPAWAAATLRRSAAIMPLADLVRGFSGFDEQQAVVAYAESAVAAEVLIAQLGSNLGPFLEMVGHGSSIDQALLEFHVQPNAFEARVGAAHGRAIERRPRLETPLQSPVACTGFFSPASSSPFAAAPGSPPIGPTSSSS